MACSDPLRVCGGLPRASSRGPLLSARRERTRSGLPMRRVSVREFSRSSTVGHIRNPAAAVAAASRPARRRQLRVAVPKAGPREPSDADSRFEAPSSPVERKGSGCHSACATCKKCAAICGLCCKFRQSRCPHQPRTEGAESRCRCAENVASACAFICHLAKFYSVPSIGFLKFLSVGERRVSSSAKERICISLYYRTDSLSAVEPNGTRRYTRIVARIGLGILSSPARMFDDETHQ